MGKRKRLAAEARKAAQKTQYFAKAKSVPSSPRKMRYVVDLIRGMEVNRALATLHFNKKAAAADVEKLLRSAIANWEQKNDQSACVPPRRAAATASASAAITSLCSLTLKLMINQ